VSVILGVKDVLFVTKLHNAEQLREFSLREAAAPIKYRRPRLWVFSRSRCNPDGREKQKIMQVD
jgi:hypothetical protein